MNNSIITFIKILYKTIKYIPIYMIFIFFSKKIENKHEIFINSNLSLIKVLNSFENLQIDHIKNPKELELVDVLRTNHLDMIEQNNSKCVSDEVEIHLEAENNSTSEKLHTIPKIKLPFEEVNSVLIDRKLGIETESPKNIQTEAKKHKVVNHGNREELESEILKLMKRDKKLLRELEKTEFIVNIYSKAFLSDSSVRNTIKFIKKYELLRKRYQENRELLNKKKADLD
ncbi:uncharacterized protein ELE39_002969 [Cryptosporidium sp. chipmunk genotype I]|uniref:uncharacterized protein n=1 Tax=Cryptosporidium sp. chipmunk genotype I TaxID=1280935 RepID=UPI00351A52D2|nr:hypothetical protein ELE39_002969 [Cryptosporidium sp. chipmunk genotype I]